ncbi:HipA domain-containing protein [Polaromonas sp. CF318]|uniref:type II toxin-antitoxin system HipA family toxin n=1 Tax=Polaromonas sp. CF318 TaxID=1144318 RepID=UPI000270FA0B|nr:type II toxin-antitoxin system HipA family toxin [Polaromonas sp. CF318]EJL78459.1 HipA domain-containing protein [Polaromonas sp. CF318]
MAFADLDVWMNGQHVGLWFWTRTGTPGFRYDESWLRSPQSRPLSVSLPMPAGGGDVTGAKVEHYFDNLLPDSGRIRERLRRRFGTSSIRAADLLAAVGRDCVGALQLMPQGLQPPPHDRIDSTPLSDSQVEKLLGEVTGDGAEGSSLADDFRISIAGAQEKTALLRIGRRWHLPSGSTPTTHIFKLPLGLVGNMRADMTDSVENEWLCATLLGELGFEVAPTEMGRFGERKVLIVERFDRRWMDDGAWIARLPQEDFCQATGTPGDLKYESDGGPGLRAGLDLLGGGSHARSDILQFVRVQLAFWIMAATDGHAKNFSIFLERGGGFRMTPLYDVLSAWPIIGSGPNQLSPRRAKLAMALRNKNAHYHLHEIRTRHWEALARQSGVPGAFDQMVALVLQVPDALERVAGQLPPDFPEPVFTAIRRGMLAQAGKFVDELP